MEENVVELLIDIKNLLKDIECDISEWKKSQGGIVMVDNDNNELEVKPLPCELCGSTDVEVGKSKSFGCYVRCNDCFESVNNMPTRNDAVKAWNRRGM